MLHTLSAEIAFDVCQLLPLVAEQRWELCCTISAVRDNNIIQYGFYVAISDLVPTRKYFQSFVWTNIGEFVENLNIETYYIVCGKQINKFTFKFLFLRQTIEFNNPLQVVS